MTGDCLGNRKRMKQICQEKDVFVFLSLFERVGIVVIETQVAGMLGVCIEGLPPKKDITSIYWKLLLDDDAEKWTNVALEMENYNLKR